MGNLFNGQTQIPYNYSCYGWVRNSGKTFHAGQDIVGLDDTTILMPTYKGISIKGTVRLATIVTNKNNKTWEWGYFVAVTLDANQTKDTVNELYFAHCSKLLVKKGDKVKSGDKLAIMGNTGNAALASPPFKHCHFEVRAKTYTPGLDPSDYSGCENKVGVYGKSVTKEIIAVPLVSGLRLRPFPEATDDNENDAINYLEKGKEYKAKQTRDGWVFILTEKNSGGWACIKDDKNKYIELR